MTNAEVYSMINKIKRGVKRKGGFIDGEDARRIAEKQAMVLAVKAGQLPSASSLPYRFQLDQDDIYIDYDIVGDEVVLKERFLNAVIKTADGDAYIGFDTDGNPHICFENEADEIAFRLAL